MITVKIPAAIGESSPVIVTDPNGHTLVGVVAMMWDGPWVTIRPTGGEQPPYSVWIPGWVGASVALDISRPTGAAHLAWWLAPPRLTQAQHDATLEALGVSGYNFLQMLGLARVGDVAKIDARGLEIICDYAHRVAGVTNG